jgi:predicted ribosome quality control (RQC) complex YloA/Tae2 family protein
MSLNYLEIEKVLDAFPKQGIIKKCFQSGKSSLLINIFDGKKDNLIYASVKDGKNAIFLIPEGGDFKKEELRFSQLLNSNITGGRLKSFSQYDNSRIIVMELSLGDKVKKIIYRLWGAGGNIIFADEDNTIIECLRRMPSRGEWPGESFVFPEIKVQTKIFHVREEFNTQNINEKVYEFFPISLI